MSSTNIIVQETECMSPSNDVKLLKSDVSTELLVHSNTNVARDKRVLDNLNDIKYIEEQYAAAMEAATEWELSLEAHY
jgi:hypothetical protein